MDSPSLPFTTAPWSMTTVGLNPSILFITGSPVSDVRTELFPAVPRSNPALARTLARFGFLVPEPPTAKSSPYEWLTSLVLGRSDFDTLGSPEQDVDNANALLARFESAMAGEDRVKDMTVLIREWQT